MRCLVDYVGTYFKKKLDEMIIIPQAKPALSFTR